MLLKMSLDYLTYGLIMACFGASTQITPAYQAKWAASSTVIANFCPSILQRSLA